MLHEHTFSIEGHEDLDVLFDFSSDLLTKGCAARTYGDPMGCYPAEPNEWIHTLHRAVRMGSKGHTYPLSIPEKSLARAWFYGAEGQAVADRLADEAERSP